MAANDSLLTVQVTGLGQLKELPKEPYQNAAEAWSTGEKWLCFTCRYQWPKKTSPTVPPLAAFVFVTDDEEHETYVWGLCGPCAQRPDLDARIDEAVERQFGEARTVLPVAAPKSRQ